MHRPLTLAHTLTIPALVLALLLGALVLDSVASTGLLKRTVSLETETFQVLSKYPPLKFVVPSPQRPR